MYNIIVFAMLPFAILMAAEYAYGVMRGRNTYRLNDTISSLSQGLISQWVGVCTLLFQVGLYSIAYHYVAVFGNADAWNCWYGWVAAVLLFDFCDYWLHRAGHEHNILWAAHVVHHQSEHFNFSTALRQESLTEVLGWPFFLPMAVLGVPPEMFGIAGLIVNVYQLWVHTEHVGKLGWFDKVFSSPSNHRVHHAVDDQYINKNYGGMLVIWDRMFGTFAEENEPCTYGTRVPLESRNPVWAIAAVYCSIAKDMWNTRRWSDKIRVLLMPPGWRPADVAERFPIVHSDIRKLDRYGRSRRSARWLAGTLFFLLALISGFFLWHADGLPWAQSALGALAFLAGVIGVERLLNRPSAPRSTSYSDQSQRVGSIGGALTGREPLT
jgi:sterol desaturase/sphingolipid hydroxylase (fatty acid hydroxylase superfamily)